MGNLKLPKLPERAIVKCTIQLTPVLEKSLQDYAAAYEAEYGQPETITDLIPHMLVAFLASDRGFARNRKA